VRLLGCEQWWELEIATTVAGFKLDGRLERMLSAFIASDPPGVRSHRRRAGGPWFGDRAADRDSPTPGGVQRAQPPPAVGRWMEVWLLPKGI